MKQDKPNDKLVTAVPRSWWWIGLVGILVAGSLPVIGQQLRKGQARCALDGQTIDPTFRVMVVEKDGARRIFCCIACTELWLRRSKAIPHQVLVTDEVTGQPVNAADAYFVRSSVTSNAPTRDRRHVFSRRDVAELHAKSFHGRVLTGDDCPFSDLPLSRPGVGANQNSPSVEQLISS